MPDDTPTFPPNQLPSVEELQRRANMNPNAGIDGVKALPTNWPLTHSWADRLAAYDGPPDFIVPSLVPRGLVTTLFGRDGLGKSTLLMLIGMRLAMGRCGLTGALGDRQQKVWFLGAEDTENAILTRFQAIRHYLKPYPHETVPLEQNFVMPEMKGMDLRIHGRTDDGKLTPNEFGQALQQKMAYHRPDVVILDPLSDFFVGNQNSLSDAGPFMTYFDRQAAKNNMAVILVGHPARAEDSKYAGHAVWSSKSRSRLWLEKNDTGLWFTQEKSSYGPKHDDIRLNWTDTGVLYPMSETERNDVDAAIRAAILEALPRWADQGKVASAKANGPNKIPKLLSKETDYEVSDIKRVETTLREQKLIAETLFDGTNNTPDIRNTRNEPKRGLWLTNH